MRKMTGVCLLLFFGTIVSQTKSGNPITYKFEAHYGLSDKSEYVQIRNDSLFLVNEDNIWSNFIDTTGLNPKLDVLAKSKISPEIIDSMKILERLVQAGEPKGNKNCQAALDGYFYKIWIINRFIDCFTRISRSTPGTAPSTTGIPHSTR